MENNKKVTLPSGAVLTITAASFPRARSLFKAVLEELKSVKVDAKEQMLSAMKDLACTAFSSNKIESALNDCLLSVLYDGAKINADTFEPVEKRQDYPVVMFEVAQENLLPFMSSLYALLSPLQEKAENSRA